MKATCIEGIYHAQPMAYPVFLLICTYARKFGIIPSYNIELSDHAKIDKGSYLMRSVELHALIIDVLHLHQSIATDVAHQDRSSRRFHEMLSDMEYSNISDKQLSWLGHALLTFFHRIEGMRGSGSWTFSWPINSSLKQSLTSVVVDSLADICRRSRYILTFSQSWSYSLEYLLNSDKQARRVDILIPPSLAEGIMKCETFHIKRLEFLTGKLQLGVLRYIESILLSSLYYNVTLCVELYVSKSSNFPHFIP